MLFSPFRSKLSSNAIVSRKFTFLEICFVQVIPQAVCSRHGLAISANMIWLVKILMGFCWLISYSIGKVTAMIFEH